ncbi:MAG: YqaA family protein [Pseudomonadota bacterium]
MSILAAYGGLFLSALVAATLVPAQSELVLVGLILSGDHSVALLVAVASAGNILGSTVNYFLGRFAQRQAHRKWFPATQVQLRKASGWYGKYGRFSLLLSWVPIIGDPITVAAGVLREPLWSFILLVTLAKTGRYVVLAAATLGWP